MRLVDADEIMEHVWRDKLDSRELIADMILHSPTVDPRGTAYWRTQDEGSFYPLECSNCNTEPVADDYGYVVTPFCPHCGFRMIK